MNSLLKLLTPHKKCKTDEQKMLNVVSFVRGLRIRTNYIQTTKPQQRTSGGLKGNVFKAH